MRGRVCRPRNGVTLVELLVVLGIIGILAALVLVAMEAVWGHADREEAASTVKRLYLAIEDYKLYGPTKEYPVDDTDNHVLFTPTAGYTGTDHILDKLKNTRSGQELFQFDHNALGDSGETLMDPWEQPYFYDLDGDSLAPPAGWTDWGVTHQVKIFSCGEKNCKSDLSAPTSWNKTLMIYRKDK